MRLALTLLLASLVGCGADPAATPASPADSGAPSDVTYAGAVPTWAEHVAPIVFAKCASCHRAGGIAPFSLLTYNDARIVARGMRDATLARRMPPTVINASGSCNTFRSEVEWLTDAEINTIGHWASNGTPEGDPSRAPAPPPAPGGLDRVDTRIDTGVSFMPLSTVTDQYRCFVADPGFTADRFVTGYHVVPGDARVVHHVIVYSVPTAEAEVAATRADTADPLPGYTCFGGPGVTGSAPVALWAPGGAATRFPDGTGLRLTASRKLIIQVHYNTLNGIFPDRTAVQLRTEPMVTAEARLIPVSASDITIPPRASLTTVSGQRSVTSMLAPRGVRIYGTAPHMHGLGRVQRLSSSDNTCLSDVTRWNFHWQRLFFYEHPVELAPGQTITVSCGYDSTQRDAVTRRGEGTEDEMCLNYLYLTGR